MLDMKKDFFTSNIYENNNNNQKNTLGKSGDYLSCNFCIQVN